MIELVGLGALGSCVHPGPRELVIIDGTPAYTPSSALGQLGAVACIPPTNPPRPPIRPTIVFPSIPLSVGWDAFWNGGWDAPGGNHWWRSKLIAEADPTAKKGLSLAMARSKKHFADKFGPGKEYGGMSMKDVLARYKDKLVTAHGSLRAPVTPSASERADAFVRRGGYLLWVDPETGVFEGRQSIVDEAKIIYTAVEGVERGRDLDRTETKLDLFVKYYPGTKTVRFLIRRYITTEEKAIHGLIWFMNQLSAGGSKFCSLVTHEKVTQAAAYAAAVPQATPYIAGWQAATQVCGMVFPIPTCAPSTSTPQLPSSAITPQLPTDTPWLRRPSTYVAIGGGAVAIGAIALVLRARR